MDARLQIRLDSDSKRRAEDALPEGMTLSCLFALVEAMQASLNKQAKALAWLQRAVASLSEHLLLEPPPRGDRVTKMSAKCMIFEDKR